MHFTRLFRLLTTLRLYNSVFTVLFAIFFLYPGYGHYLIFSEYVLSFSTLRILAMLLYLLKTLFFNSLTPIMVVLLIFYDSFCSHFIYAAFYESMDINLSWNSCMSLFIPFVLLFFSACYVASCLEADDEPYSFICSINICLIGV